MLSFIFSFGCYNRLCCTSAKRVEDRVLDSLISSQVFVLFYFYLDYSHSPVKSTWHSICIIPPLLGFFVCFVFQRSMWWKKRKSIWSSFSDHLDTWDGLLLDETQADNESSYKCLSVFVRTHACCTPGPPQRSLFNKIVLQVTQLQEVCVCELCVCQPKDSLWNPTERWCPISVLPRSLSPPTLPVTLFQLPDQPL